MIGRRDDDIDKRSIFQGDMITHVEGTNFFKKIGFLIPVFAYIFGQVLEIILLIQSLHRSVR